MFLTSLKFDLQIARMDLQILVNYNKYFDTSLKCSGQHISAG